MHSCCKDECNTIKGTRNNIVKMLPILIEKIVIIEKKK